jgi:hypothetical protein
MDPFRPNGWIRARRCAAVDRAAWSSNAMVQSSEVLNVSAAERPDIEFPIDAVERRLESRVKVCDASVMIVYG